MKLQYKSYEEYRQWHLSKWPQEEEAVIKRLYEVATRALKNPPFKDLTE